MNFNISFPVIFNFMLGINKYADNKFAVSVLKIDQLINKWSILDTSNIS